MPNFVEVEKTKDNAWVPLVGFIMMVILAAIAFMLAPMAHEWLVTTRWVAGSTSVLPIRFPGDWTPIMVRSAVAMMVWLPMFAIVMIALLLVMGSGMGPTDISLKEIREEKKQMTGGRRRRR
jgi:hypothetical protein